MERKKPFLTEEEKIKAKTYGESDVDENLVLYPPNTLSCDDPNHLKRTVANGSDSHRKYLEGVRKDTNSKSVLVEKPQDIHNPQAVYIIRRRRARKPR